MEGERVERYWEEVLEGEKRDKVEMQDVLVVEEDIKVNFPLSPFLLVSFPCSSCSMVLPPKRN